MVKNKKLLGGEIVGIGSDFVVIKKNNSRYLVQVKFETLKELKNATTPYGSQI